MKGVIALEDGFVLEGQAFGAEGETVGEVVFNTQVVGYQEILTDPSYRKQIVVMGYPHIGNYGINDRCNESDSTHASALIVKEASKIYSNWQAKGSVQDFMKKGGVIGLEDVDTRALVTHIRDNGEMRGVVSTKDLKKDSLIQKAKDYKLPNLVSEIKSAKSQVPSPKFVIINLGVNNSVLKKFPKAAVVPYDISADEIIKMDPKQVVISSGPGDPTKLGALIEEIKKLIDKVPLYGVQNGACVLALALGCEVSKMKVGHHGVNLPVVHPKTGVGEISVQNHSYGIDKVPKNVEVAHVNLNDKSIEKIQTKDGKCVGTLYYPIDERGKLDPGYKYV